ncbi:hypothetical protein HKD37_10G027940 [Glycine soja]
MAEIHHQAWPTKTFHPMKHTPPSHLFPKNFQNSLTMCLDGEIKAGALSTRFRTVRRESLLTSAGISPESLLPMRSRMRREGSIVTQAGISSIMSFQSATTRVVRVSMPQIAGESFLVMYPERPTFSKIGSSNS